MRKKAFTLIELMVAMGIIGMMIALASVVFRFSIDAHRVSVANAEIMQKLRAITGQLNRDFSGLRKDAPLLIWFEPNSPVESTRYDQIMFFADGAFSSIQLYDARTGRPIPLGQSVSGGSKVVRGNVARIHYGQTTDSEGSTTEPRDIKDAAKRMLGRRCHILSSDEGLDPWPNPDNMESFADHAANGELKNEAYEHDRMSLSEWKVVDGDDYASVIDKSFLQRPVVDTADPNTFHELLCEGVGSFAIQWAYWDKQGTEDVLRWFPSHDPDGDGDTGDSHFHDPSLDEEFGVYFNTPNIDEPKWYSVGDSSFIGKPYAIFPAALKFTFKLYDSNGVIKGGRTFTHVVYLGD